MAANAAIHAFRPHTTKNTQTPNPRKTLTTPCHVRNFDNPVATTKSALRRFS
jgi:hypothetical protein